MEKRRMRLEINGVVCGLITQESEEYMQTLAGEVGEMMKGVLAASPFVTREAAALTAALSYCDDAKKNGKKAFELQERVDELEVEAEIWQEEKEEMLKAPPAADAQLTEKLARLEAENTSLVETSQRVRDLEEKAALLEDENNALRETARDTAGTAELAALRERLRDLEAENAELQSAVRNNAAEGVERSELEEQLRSLKEENSGLRTALQENAAEKDKRLELEELAELLEQENAELKAAGEPDERLARLRADNEELRRSVQEQAEAAKKAEEERASAVAAAKRAMEEARRVVDQLQEEADRAKAEVQRLKRRGTSPALDLLERTAEEAEAESNGSAPTRRTQAGQASPEAQEKTGTRKRKRNPLRHEEDFEQEGFVSFFEKKG